MDMFFGLTGCELQWQALVLYGYYLAVAAFMIWQSSAACDPTSKSWLVLAGAGGGMIGGLLAVVLVPFVAVAGIIGMAFIGLKLGSLIWASLILALAVLEFVRPAPSDPWRDHVPSESELINDHVRFHCYGIQPPPRPRHLLTQKQIHNLWVWGALPHFALVVGLTLICHGSVFSRISSVL